MIAYLECSYPWGCAARIPSETDPGKEYRALVVYIPDTNEVGGGLRFSCSCPVWTNRGLACKHVMATIGAWNEALQQAQTITPRLELGRWSLEHDEGFLRTRRRPPQGPPRRIALYGYSSVR